MTAWSGGYNAVSDYTFGYVPELGPQHARLAMLAGGIEPPSSGVRCELGFGQGLSINLHAAATGEEWWGTDFNASQAAGARALAAASGAALHLFDQAFDEFCGRNDLPEFDSIGLHGIWSWVSPANRAIILDFVRRKLKPGGFVYLSYNTEPGWALSGPLRHLLREYLRREYQGGGREADRVSAGLDFIDRILAVDPGFRRHNPQVVERLARMRREDPVYVAHEFLGEHWDTFSFPELERSLADARVEFAVSADLSDAVEAAYLSPPQQTFLSGIRSVAAREAARGFMSNRQFRRDYWTRGRARLSVREVTDRLAASSIVLCTPRADVPRVVRTAVGEVELDAATFGPMLDVLSSHEAMLVEALLGRLAHQGQGLAHVAQACLLLGYGGHVAFVQPPEAAASARESARRFNNHVVERSAWSTELEYLASPVTGGAVRLSNGQLLFLRALRDGLDAPDAWPDYCLEAWEASGRTFLLEGRPERRGDSTREVLARQAAWFAAARLPALRALDVV